MDVSPGNSGTIRLEGEDGDVREPTVYPTPDADAIDCFGRNEMITMTANPKAGYQFDYWEFNYWPTDLNENIDKTSNPIPFTNSYLANDDNDSDGYTEAIGDCNDSNASIHPGAEEICGDGIDQDCNGSDLLCDGSINNDIVEYPVDYNTIRAITAHFTLSSAPPDAPENVSATDGTHTGMVAISWDSATGATSYEVFRADSFNGNKTKISSPSETAYEDTAIFQDNTYYYWIKAVNRYGSSPYSAYDTGYAYVNVEDPPQPVYESSPITPEDAKQMLDTDRDVIILDVSISDDYERNHILCAINSHWNGMFDYVNYAIIADYRDFPILVYDQDDFVSELAADYLAEEGFSMVYHMTGGLVQWMANSWETVDSDHLYECSLPPMALAGTDDDGNENEQVSLDGSGSAAPDKRNLTYEWQQQEGSDAVIETPSSAMTDVTLPYVQEGGEKLIFHLEVTDSENNKDTDSVAIDVIWQNSPPVADAGDFQSVAEGDIVYLTASGSTDRDDGIDTYQWKQISGPEAGLQNSTSETAQFTAPAVDAEADEAELVFELTVTDKGGLSDTAQVTILVSKNNAPPVADGGTDQSVTETHSVELDGSESHDADDGIVSYAWTQINGPTVELSSHSDIKPTFTAPEVDDGSIVLQFQLTVTDFNGEQDVDEVEITVNNVGEPPTADAGTDQSPAYEGWLITLDGSASADGDGEIDTYQWTQTSGPQASLTGKNTPAPEFIVPKISGETVQLVFQLTVTDDSGLTGTDQVKIVVDKAIEPPVAGAGADQEVHEGDTVVLDASDASDPDDGIILYSWHQVGGVPAVELSDNSAINPEFTVPNIDEAETVLTFGLTVTDYSGNEDTDEVDIRVLRESDSDDSCFISTIK